MYNDASRLQEIVEEMQNLIQEAADICRHAMTTNQYETFKYRTLAHIEPGISKETQWVPDMGITSLEELAENMADEAEYEEDEDEDEDEDEEDENMILKENQ